MATPEYDTIVIGGGVAGLACALLRARRGERVALLERSPHLSPTLHGFVRQGVYLDSGFHYAGSMGPDGLLRYLLSELGLAEQIGEAVQTLDAVDRVRFVKPAFDFQFPQGWEPLEESLCRVFPAQSGGVQSFLAEVRTLWEQGRRAFTQDRGRSLGAVFAGGGGSLHEAIGRRTGDPVLGGLLSAHGVLYGTTAQETSLLFHSQVAGSYYESACMIRGGGQVWVQTFAKALSDARVAWTCDRKVARLCVNEGREFTAVETEDGERIPARRCISTMHPKLMLETAPANAFSPAYRKRVRELEETPSAVVLYGRCPGAGFSGNLILADGPQAFANWMHRPVETRPLFVSSPVETDGVSVICPACLADVPGNGERNGRRRPEGYQCWKMRLRDRLVQRLAGEAQDLLGSFEPLDVATPLTFRDRLSSPEGGLYGIKHRMVDMPLLPRTAVKGLYVSGQAVVAPGVLGALCASFFTESCIV